MRNFTRGGQIFAHRLRMMKQVTKTSFLLSLGACTLWLFYYICVHTLYAELYTALVGIWAMIKIEIAHVFQPKKPPFVDYYYFGKEIWVTLKAVTFLKTAHFNASLLHLELWGRQFLFESFIVWLTSLISVMGYFSRRGYKNTLKTHLRGGAIVKDSVLKRILQKNRKNSDISIGNIPLVRATETQHILLCGTSGSGKTTWMHHLVPRIRKKRQKAVIVDMVGSFVERYYREGHDILLNPFDMRGAYWTPWADITSDESYETITSAMTSMSSSSNSGAGDFFDKTASILLKSILKKLKEDGQTTNAALYNMVSSASNKELSSYLEGTPGGMLASPSGKETTMSIRSTLLMKLETLSHLKDRPEKPFSIKEFMEGDDDRCLFLSVPKADQIEPLKNLVATWMNVAIYALMNQPESFERRVWFLMDELPSVGKIPSLLDAVTRVRKYGGCVVASIQNLSQLDSIYGHHDRETLIGNFNTKAIFRATNGTTSEYFSKTLGQIEQRRTQENITYGAHEMRDGISLNEVEKIDSVVLPSEIEKLNDRECFVKLPGDYPVAKTLVSIPSRKEINPSFIAREERV